MAKKSTPVVRVPGFSRDELRLIDRCAGVARLSRAAWIRLVALAVAQDGVQVNLTRVSIRHGVKGASAGSKPALPPPRDANAEIQLQSDLAASGRRLIKSFDPDL
jgi:hypothetical protein